MVLFPNSKQKKRQSFSLIEILVFVSVLGLFFILALTITVFSLRRLQENQHKIIATHYSDQLKEWFLYQKEKDGNTFFQLSGSYCFNDENTLDWSSPGVCSSSCPGTNCLSELYNRSAVFTINGDGSSSVEIIVSWTEIDKQRTIDTKTIFSIWEK